MIKIYCNQCGKEITGNVYRDIEETCTVGLGGEVVAKWAQALHYCDKCQELDLTCGFKVGDKVITDDGRVGVIESICDCENCKERGFYEPRVKMEIGDNQIWITNTDKRNKFSNFYKIGDQVFGNLDDKYVLSAIQSKKEYIKEQQEELAQLEAQLDVVHKLKDGDHS